MSRKPNSSKTSDKLGIDYIIHAENDSARGESSHRASGERRHTCEFCAKKFFSKGDLTKHIRGVHQNQRPHRCDKCPWDFTERGNLNKHMDRKHAESRKHKCVESGCDKAFKTSDSLRRHMQQVHKLPRS